MYNEVEKSLCTSQQAILNILYKPNSDFVLSGLGLVAPTDDFFRISTLCTLPTGSNLSILTQKYFVWKQPCTKFTTAIYQICTGPLPINGPVQILYTVVYYMQRVLSPEMVICWININLRPDQVQDLSALGKCSRQQTCINLTSRRN